MPEHPKKKSNPQPPLTQRPFFEWKFSAEGKKAYDKWKLSQEKDGPEKNED